MLFLSGKTKTWKNTNLDFNIDNSSILKVENFKYIGDTIGSNFNWSKHIEAVKTKLLNTIGIFIQNKVLFKSKFFVLYL